MYDPDQHHRRSIRYQGFDYSSPGAYFVTLCIQDRRELLGTVSNGEMRLSAAGQMVETYWRQLSCRFEFLELDIWQVMPDHIHGVLLIRDRIRTEATATPEPLSAIIRWFKVITTNAYIHGVRETSWPPFPGRLWHRNYFERVIRSETELNAIRQYVSENPQRWTERHRHP